MWRWEDVKMRRCFTDPHYWKNPALRRSREKQEHVGHFTSLLYTPSKAASSARICVRSVRIRVRSVEARTGRCEPGCHWNFGWNMQLWPSTSLNSQFSHKWWYFLNPCNGLWLYNVIYHYQPVLSVQGYDGGDLNPGNIGIEASLSATWCSSLFAKLVHMSLGFIVDISLKFFEYDILKPA